MTCHWFRHHAGVICIPMSTLQRSVLVLDATSNGCRCSSGERYRATINHKRLCSQQLGFDAVDRLTGFDGC
jgi:3,4-dihydroxy-2-butanone 4-phosphate synthase